MPDAAFEFLETFADLLLRDPSIRIQRFRLQPQLVDPLAAPLRDAPLNLGIPSPQPEQLLGVKSVINRWPSRFHGFFDIRVGYLLQRVGGNFRLGIAGTDFPFTILFRRGGTDLGLSGKNGFLFVGRLKLGLPRLFGPPVRAPSPLGPVTALAARFRIVGRLGRRRLGFEDFLPVELDIRILFFDPADRVFIQGGPPDLDPGRSPEPVKKALLRAPLTSRGVHERCRFVPALVASKPQEWQYYLRLGDRPTLRGARAATLRGGGLLVFADFRAGRALDLEEDAPSAFAAA